MRTKKGETRISRIGANSDGRKLLFRENTRVSGQDRGYQIPKLLRREIPLFLFAIISVIRVKVLDVLLSFTTVQFQTGAG